MKLTSALLLFWILCNSSGFLPSQKKTKDYSINDTLFIGDIKSIETSVGNLKKYYLETDEDGEVVFMLNKDKSECLKLISIPGSSSNYFGEFEVTHNNSKRQRYYQSRFSSFVTESSVRLGITDSAFLRLKGIAKKIEKQPDGTVLYEYSFANDVLYHFRAWIKNGRVQKFRFGDKNP